VTGLQGVRATAVIALILSILALAVAGVAAGPALLERGRVQESCRAIRDFILSDAQLREKFSLKPPTSQQHLDRAFADRWRLYAGGITCAR
jgi:hypothetical protein